MCEPWCLALRAELWRLIHEKQLSQYRAARLFLIRSDGAPRKYAAVYGCEPQRIYAPFC